MSRPAKLGFVFALVVSVCVAGSSWAGVTFFIDDEAGFNAAVSGFTFEGTEDWESSNLPPNDCDSFPDPLAPGVPNGPFPNGTNPDMDMTVQSNTLGGNPTVPSPGLDLGTCSQGFKGTPTDQVSTVSNFGVSYDMIFGLSDTIAFSLTPLIFDTKSTGDPGTATVRVYDTSNVLIGIVVDIPVAGFTNPTTFVGIVATDGDRIARVNVFGTSPGDDFTGSDNMDLYTLCAADLDGSGDVGIVDFLALLAAWGPNPGHPADFDGDGIVGITDFLELLANWGPCP